MSTAYEEYEENDYFTYADVLEWDESVRAEIIDGELFMMSPPFTDHQDIAGELFARLHDFLKGKTCRAYIAPFGVRLFPQAEHSDDIYVEPDIVVVCDKSKIDHRGCNGAPDLVVEILSPSTAHYDQVVKFRLYQKAGVREYWILDGGSRVLYAHILSNGNYITNVYDEADEAPVSVLPGCVIPLNEVFPPDLSPREAQARRG
jgi:Uma2 family endonuclease